MATVALIGADGAGKTSVANLLISNFPNKMKYLYMGGNIESSNIKLPTSHLIIYIRGLLKKKSNKDSGILSSLNNNLKAPDEWWVGDNRGKIFAFLRMINRITEDLYRLLYSWIYQIRGYTVIFDRHTHFEKLRDYNISKNGEPRFSERIYFWIIQHIYPKPSYIIFLDAPPEVLYKRKGETTIEFIEYTRRVYLEAGEKMDNFSKVNVDQPLEKICDEICSIIHQSIGTKSI